MTKEELLALGINVDDLIYPNGEMNVIVQCFGQSKDENERKEEPLVRPDIYQPRRNEVWSCGCQDDYIPLSDEEEKQDYVKHLKDSVGRLRIMALLLEKQAHELETQGYFTTTCYYPDLDEIGYNGE